MKFINFNYTQEPETVTTASSSNVNYPVSNISKYFRNKTWRSKGTGNFVISTNNKIDFKESALGSELTATITAGTYTSTTLATELKTQLEAIGAETYTVSFSQTTGLWTVTSSGVYFSILNLTGTNQATSILKNHLGFANSDRTGSLTYAGSNISIHTEEWIKFDLITTESIDSVVLLFPKEDGIQLSSNAVVKVQANATDTWSSPAVDQTLTIDNTYEIASHYFTTDQNYRYWRISIVDSANVNLYVSLGVVILGKSEFVHTPDNGITYSLTDTSSVQRNDFGNEFVDEYPCIATLDMNLSVMDYADAKIIENAFRINGVRKPIFIAIDETSSVFNKNHFAIYGKFEPTFGLSQVYYDIFNTEISIKEVT